MPVLPNLLERLFLGLGALPSAMVDVWAAGAMRAAATAIEMGVFDALRKGPRTTGDLAGALGAEPRALGALLELLHRTGYLRRADERWANTTMATKWLGGERSVAHLVWHWNNVVIDLFADLPDTIRRGRTRVHFHEWLSERPERWRIFNSAMAEIARGGADEIAERTPLPPGATTLIDIGGNHAIDAMAFCRRYPSLTATVFDLPEAFGDGRVRVREAGLAERVRFTPGDFVVQELGSGFDAALLLNVLHYQRANENVALLRKTHDALAPGGVVAILEQLPDAAPTPMFKAFMAFFDLICVTAMGGGVATYASIVEWLGDAGFTGVRRIALRRTPASALIVASKPAPVASPARAP